MHQLCLTGQINLSRFSFLMQKYQAGAPAAAEADDSFAQLLEHISAYFVVYNGTRMLIVTEHTDNNRQCLK